VHTEDLRKVFGLIDVNKDGFITFDDFHCLFNAHPTSQGQEMDHQIWKELLQETGREHDEKVDFADFTKTMTKMVRKSWLREEDRTPGKRSMMCQRNSEFRTSRRVDTSGQIISPFRKNPF
jgi:Ca2+-binding EF-hand superfamily protein